MRFQTKLLLFVLAAVALISSGCGKYKNTSSGTPDSGTVLPVATNNPTGTIPGTPGHTDTLDTTASVWSTGGSAIFKPVDNTIFNKWVGGYQVDPQNAMINVNMKQATGKATYYGDVKIRYTDNGITYEATLKSGSTTYDGKDYYMYNYWFDQGGKQVFSGIFDDKVGAIILVIDEHLDLGDGGGASEIGGEIWFKNYGASWATYDQGAAWSIVLPCWFRTIGPYDCRNNSVMTKSSLYPSDGYEKLGDFSNMNKLKAFAN